MPTAQNQPTVDDTTLVRRCLEYDATAQRMLYDRYKNRMMAFCRRYFQRTDLAEEFFQEGFIRFFQKIDQYNPAYPLYPYLKKIFLRAGLNYLQQFFSEKNNTEVLTDTMADQIPEISIHFLDTIHYHELMNILYSLSEAEAVIIQLALIDGWTHEEIAGMLEISEANSRTRLFRARQKLLAKLNVRATSSDNRSCYG